MLHMMKEVEDRICKNWIDADKYLSSMRLVISQIDQNSQYNNEIEQIIKDCDKVKMNSISS